MYKGIYVALSGAVLRSQELDTVANNLANINTIGFKKSSFSSRLYPLLEGTDEKQGAAYPEAKAMAYFGQYHIDQSEGALKNTGNALDIAVKGEGFFAVQRQGQTFYTRNGAFTRDKEGFLVTQDGFNVLDAGGNSVNLGNKGTVNITSDGMVYNDGNNIARIRLAKVENAIHASDSLFSGKDAGNAGGEIVQGELEMSNVNPVREMIGIILAQRQFQAAISVIQSLDDLAKQTPQIVKS
jgi:flagellar basal-body rod protein FlgG